MKTIPVMEMRRHLGAILDDVRLKSETIIVERAGKPIVILSPVEHTEYPSGKTTRRLRAVKEMAGIYETSMRGKSAQKWINTERDNW